MNTDALKQNDNQKTISKEEMERVLVDAIYALRKNGLIDSQILSVIKHIKTIEDAENVTESANNREYDTWTDLIKVAQGNKVKSKR